MQSAKIFINNIYAGRLIEKENQLGFSFKYEVSYKGPPISLTMPVEKISFDFKTFPPFFDGLLPEGLQLEALLRQAKLDRNNYLGQLIAVGRDPVGAVSIYKEEML